jgi:hypothetical protein
MGRVSEWREARSRRRAIKQWAAASDTDLREDYARFWWTDHHLETALQALHTAREHAEHVPYSGPNVTRLRRVASRLHEERSAREANTGYLEAEMYRRWGRPTGQNFHEWIRPFRDEAREAARPESGED